MPALSNRSPAEPAAWRVLLVFVGLLVIFLFRAFPLEAQGLIDPRSGRLFLAATDLTVDGGPATLEVRRSLSHTGNHPGLLGKGWRLNWEVRLVQTESILLIEEAGIVRQYEAGSKPGGIYTLPSGERVVMERDGRGVRTTPEGLTEIFDTKGWLIEREDNNGNRTTLRYDPQGRLARIEGPKGSFLTLLIDKSGRVSRIEGSNGRAVHYGYDKTGRLTEVRGPSDLPARYGYTSGGQLAQIDDVQSGSARFAYDTKGRVLSRRREDGKQDRYEYDDRTSRVRIIAADGGVTSIQWSADGKRQEVIDPLGRKSVLEYDAAGRPLSITGPAGGTSRISYDGLGRTVAVVDPAGQQSRFEYVGESSSLQRMQQSGGAEQVYEYDTKGNLISIKTGGIAATTLTYHPDGSLAGIEAQGQPKQLYAYYPDGRQKSVANAQGDTTQFEYDRRGNPIREVNPLGGITVRQYDAHDRLISRTDPAGGITRYEYDVKGRVSRLTDAGGGVTRFEYDARGRRVADVNPKGQVTRYEYDGAWRLTRLVEPGNQISTFRYDSLGNLVAETDPDGRTVRYKYDPAGRLQKEQGPTGLEIVYQYDAAGNLVGLDDSLRTGIRFQRDPAGLLTAVVNPLGAVTKYEYDPFGNPLVVSDSLGRLTRYTYDLVGSLSRVVLPTGDEARYEYDSAGRLTAIHQPGGGVSRFSYDAMGQPNSLTDPAGGRVERRYDPAGRLVAMTNAAGQVTKFSYDRSDRLTEKQRGDGSRLQYQYDPLGALIQIDDGAFPIRFTYDQAGRLARTDYPSIKRHVRYLFNQAGHRTGLIDAAGREIRYDYTKTGQLQAIVLPDGKQIALTYDQKDRLVKVRYPNGVTGQWEYDASGQTAAIRYQGKNGQSLARRTYRYDASGNPVEAQDHLGRTSRFQYDALDQLVEATGPEGTARYRYLAGGNRARIETAGTVTEYRYDQAGRLLQAGGETFGYDPDGHLVSRTGPAGTTKYEYDPEGRLAKVAGPDATVTSFGYAPTGERAWKRDRDGLRYFLYDGLDLIQELAEDGSPRATYVHAPGVDRPLAMIRDGGIYYYQADHLGSVTHLTGEQGEVVASYDYDPFGRIVRHEGTIANPFAFTGREFDRETGLYYYRARYYDPVLGRFLSPDPAAPRLRQPQTLNPYLYVRNNPLRYIDPMGLYEWPEAWVNFPDTAKKISILEESLNQPQDPIHESNTRWIEEHVGPGSANKYQQSLADQAAADRVELARLRARLPSSPTPNPTRPVSIPRSQGDTKMAMPRPGVPAPEGPGIGPRGAGALAVVMTAAQLYNCYERGLSPAECAKEITVGLAVGGAMVAVIGPTGALVLTAASGAISIKEGIVELSQDWKDWQARRQIERETEAKQKNLKRMEELIAGLEAKADGEMAAARNRMNATVAKAQHAAQTAEQAGANASNLLGQLKGLDEVIAKASAACKAVEQLLGEVVSRTANVKRYAERVEKGIEEGWKKVMACQSTDEINKAVQLANAAKPLAQGVAQNYRQAEEAMSKLDRIKALSEQARGHLGSGQSIVVQITAATNSATDHLNEVWNQAELTKSALEALRARKAALLTEATMLRGAFPDDAAQADQRLKPLVARLEAEEQNPNIQRIVDRAEYGRNHAHEILGNANNLLAALTAFPLCDGISLPRGQLDDAARAMASMGLGGFGERIEEEAKSCLARLKPSKKPESPLPPTPSKILSHFSVSCRPNRIKVGQTVSCRATGEYLDQPGVVVDLTGTATWSPGPTIRGDEPGSYFAGATHAGASGSATVTVIEDEQKRPPDDGRKKPPDTDDGRKKSPGIDVGGKKPPDIKGATEAGEEFGKGLQSRGPTSGAAGGGPPVEQPGLQPPPGEQPPTVGAGGPAGPGAGQGVWCYFEKTPGMMVQYWLPEGPCPPVGHPPPDPRVPWQGLVPPRGGVGGGHGGGGGPKPPSGGGKGGGSKPQTGKTRPSLPPGPTCGSGTFCRCASGKTGHIPCDKSKGPCHCGGN